MPITKGFRALVDEAMVQQAAFILGEYFGVDPYTFLSFGQILAQVRCTLTAVFVIV